MRYLRPSEVPYETIPREGRNQYSREELDYECSVEARYRTAELKRDRGDRFIEALPRERRGVDEICEGYTRPAPPYSRKEIESMDDGVRMQAAELLREMRIPLDFHGRLEKAVSDAIRRSYRSRSLALDAGVPKLVGKTNSASKPGFALLGFSGCGKSSALEFAVEDSFPRAIVHDLGKFGIMTQVPVIVLSCTSGGNVKNLYSSAGAKLDRALDLPDRQLERYVASGGDVDGRSQRLQDLIERFAVGLIVIDEIQELRSVDGKTRKDALRSLLRLQNQTKVAIGVVGTDEAYDRLFNTQFMSRRTGQLVKADKYCSEESFDYVLGQMWSYQFYRKKVELTEPVRKALWKESHGLVDVLCGILVCMQVDAIESGAENVTAKAVRDTVKENYPWLRDTMGRMIAGEEAREYREKARESAERTHARITAAVTARDEVTTGDLEEWMSGDGATAAKAAGKAAMAARGLYGDVYAEALEMAKRMEAEGLPEGMDEDGLARMVTAELFRKKAEGDRKEVKAAAKIRVAGPVPVGMLASPATGT